MHESKPASGGRQPVEDFSLTTRASISFGAFGDMAWQEKSVDP
jgi:hypothetical protein